MMKKIVVILLLALVPIVAEGQNVRKKKKPAPTPPTVLSVGEILGNYGLDSALVNDTAAAIAAVDTGDKSYVDLTSLCVSLRTKAQQALQSIENDYVVRDSLVWIDSNTVLGDVTIYSYRLRRYADLMGRLSVRYSRLEQQRIEAEKEAARQRAIEEARRQQEARDKRASDLKGNINRHHRAIITATDGIGVTDKGKLKALKDLYYSYLMVYNKYDLSASRATDAYNDQLDELNAFQLDLLENVLGENSLPSQIEGFKARLKVQCDKDNTDIYRSYTKVFKQTSVPISFADVSEYQEYIGRMRSVINVQERYLRTIQLRATIADGSQAIERLYGKKYRNVVDAYRETLRSLNLLPAFTTNAESLNFIQSLDDFIAAQQLYIDYYALFEEITQRSDSIMSGKLGNHRDVVSAYRDVRGSLLPMPHFTDPAGAALYEARLADVVKVQQCYMDVFSKRNDIARNDDSLHAVRKVDRTLTSGYRLLSKQVDLTPSFYTLERGNSFLRVLDKHIEMQHLAMNTVRKIKIIDANDDRITSKDITFRNIQKAYSRLIKVYRGIDEITNSEDMRRYSRQCDNIIAMQQRVLDIIAGETVNDIDERLRKESDIDKIRLTFGL